MSRHHLALQLRDGFGELGLGGVWQLRVEALTEAPHPVLFVFILDSRDTQKTLRTPDRLVVNRLACARVGYLALQVGHLGGELRLRRLRQLSVQTGRHGILAALLVLVLQNQVKGQEVGSNVNKSMSNSGTAGGAS